MSLINEALKKAQRQRMEDPVSVPPPAAGATAAPPPRISKRRPPMPASTLILLLGGGGAVVVMAAVFAYVFLIPDAPPPAPIKTHAAASPIAPTPVTPPAPGIQVPVAPAPAPVEVAVKLPSITPPVTKPAATPVAPPVQVAPVVVAPPQITPTPAAVPPTPTANPKVYEFLETLRISGIRVSATDPKVIMNDRVFRLNDLVDRNTQLRLLKVETATLIFVDPSGFEYRKNF